MTEQTDQTAQPDETTTTVVLVCQKCGPTVMQEQDDRTKCPKCGDAMNGQPLHIHIDGAEGIVPASLVCEVGIRTIIKLFDEGHQALAFDLLAKSFRVIYRTVLQNYGITHPTGQVSGAILLLKEYFEHRGRWNEMLACSNRARALSRIAALNPDVDMEDAIQGSVVDTVARVKAGDLC